MSDWMGVSWSTYFEFCLANQAVPDQTKVISLFSTLAYNYLKITLVSSSHFQIPSPNTLGVSRSTHFEFWLANQAVPDQTKVIFFFSTLASIWKSHWLIPPTSSFPAQIQNVWLGVSQTTHFKFWIANQAIPEQTNVIFLFSTLVSICRSHWLTLLLPVSQSKFKMSDWLYLRPHVWNLGWPTMQYQNKLPWFYSFAYLFLSADYIN